MRFALTGEQRQFAATLHEALSRSAKWSDLTELGVLGLMESGAGPVDLVVAFEELGHHTVPGPTIESIAVVPTLLAGDHGVATLSFPPHLPYALDADAADLVLTVDGDAVWIAEATGPALSSVDPSRRLFATKPLRQLASGVDVERAFNAGALACAAELLGAGRAMLELTVGYAKQRTQFGQPIGRFQAVKHQLADVLVGLELARPLLYGAALSGSARHFGRQGRRHTRRRPVRQGRAADPRRDRLHPGVRVEPVADQGPRAPLELGHAGRAPGQGQRASESMTRRPFSMITLSTRCSWRAAPSVPV